MSGVDFKGGREEEREVGRKEGERVVNPEAVDARIERRTNFMMACEGCVSECGVWTIVLTLSDNIYLAFIRLMSS